MIGNAENLIRMAEWLETQCKPSEFEMRDFCTDLGEFKKFLEGHDLEIGYCGCVIGCVPKAFPETRQACLRLISTGRDFTPFLEEQLGFTPGSFGHIAWGWLFSGYWQFIDNTPIGAAKRIRYYLKYGSYPWWYPKVTHQGHKHKLFKWLFNRYILSDPAL